MLRMLQLQYACIPKAEKRYFCSVKCDISDAWDLQRLYGAILLCSHELKSVHCYRAGGKIKVVRATRATRATRGIRSTCSAPRAPFQVQHIHRCGTGRAERVERVGRRANVSNDMLSSLVRATRATRATEPQSLNAEPEALLL